MIILVYQAKRKRSDLQLTITESIYEEIVLVPFFVIADLGYACT